MRDYADIYILTGSQTIPHGVARQALLATAAFRGTAMVPLSSAVADLADRRRQAYAAYRSRLGPPGEELPADFSQVVTAVAEFADGLASAAPAGATWNPRERRWAAAAL